MSKGLALLLFVINSHFSLICNSKAISTPSLQFSGPSEKKDWTSSSEVCKDQGGRLVVLNEEKLTSSVKTGIDSVDTSGK